jgi:ribose transport system substrate-binding protein
MIRYRLPCPLHRIALAMIPLALFMAGGCSSKEPAKETSGKPKTHKIGVVLPMFKHPFFIAMKNAIEEESKKLDIVVDVRDGQDDDQKQILQVQALISSGVDALVLCPRDENAAVPSIEAANRAKIPVVTVNRRVNGGDVIAYVGADDTEGGRSQGQELVKALGAKGGKIIYLQGTPGSSPQLNRNKGLKEVLASHPEITIAADQFTDFQEDKAKIVMSGLVQKFKPGTIRAIVGQADEVALPAAEVAHAAGWKDVVVIGFNGTNGAFEAIKKGELHATILQDPAEQGKLALETASQFLATRNAPGSKDRITSLPIITRENVDKYKPSY